MFLGFVGFFATPSSGFWGAGKVAIYWPHVFCWFCNGFMVDPCIVPFYGAFDSSPLGDANIFPQWLQPLLTHNRNAKHTWVD